MNDSEKQALCLKLLKTDDEDIIEQILKNLGFLDDATAWKPLGDIVDNQSIVGNQANHAVAALVEKIVNSIDAILIDECLKHDIDPRGKHAPQSVTEAIEKFFEIENGDYSKCTANVRNQLSMRIKLIATGEKTSPCYTLIDTGEGQIPDKLSKTILSLPGTSSSSKSRIPFVQGLFNMGGTAVLPYCGKPGREKHYQFVLSKRDPSLVDADGRWGFSIVRRKRPDAKHTSSTYQYLCPGGKILSFEAKNLPIAPGTYPIPYEKPLEWGTCIKLYNYKIGSYATNVLLDLLYELGRYLYRTAIPFRLYETRPYNSNYYDTTVSGLAVRLAENSSKIHEEGFPADANVHVPEIGDLPITIHALKKEYRDSKYIGDEAVIFILNGQMHAHLDSDFLRSEKVDKTYIDKDVMIIVDCTNIPDAFREDLFMPDRFRLRDGPHTRLILDQLRVTLRDHPGLKNLNMKRREDSLKEQFADDKPLKEIFSKLVTRAPTLADLFSLGASIEKPSNFDYKLDKKHPYKGEYFPSFFRLKGDQKVFESPINRSVTVTMETDAPNDYFSRSRDKGKGPYINPKSFITNFSLWEGIAKLQIKPKKQKEGEIIPVEVEITEKSRKEPFLMKFTLKITEHKDKSSPKPKPENKENESEESIDGEATINEPHHHGRTKVLTNEGDPQPSLNLPQIIEVNRDDPNWKELKFDESSGVHIKKVGEDYDVYINMSNEYYQNEYRSAKGGEQLLVKNQYKYGLVLASMAMVFKMSTKGMEDGIYEKVEVASRGIAMTIVPLIRTLGKSFAKKL